MAARSRSKMVRGVGINDAEYPVYAYETIGGKRAELWQCQIYRAWKNMMARCYSGNFHASNPTYVGCTVAPEWHQFSSFRAWMLTQDHEGKHLDKDILFPGNKVYSPDTCVFVSAQLNALMNDHGSARGECPIGVTWHKASGKFMAECRNPFAGKLDYLGRFTDPADAHEAWRARKHEHACRYADMQTDPRIATALRTRYATPAGESK